MAYRTTETIRNRKRATRDAILHAARAHIAKGGYQAAQMQAVAASAGIATGTVYRYFDSKALLFAEVFRRVAQHEVDMVAATATRGTSCRERLQALITTFTTRALRAPRLAYALLAEPVDPIVEAERIAFRQAYARIIAALLLAGIHDHSFTDQDPNLAAAALVGILSETLVGPLSPTLHHNQTPGARTNEALVQSISAICLRAVSRNAEIRPA